MSGAGGRGDGGGNTVDMDLQALVMGSESLLSHIARPDGIPRLTKSLAEIVSFCTWYLIAHKYLLSRPCILATITHSVMRW